MTVDRPEHIPNSEPPRGKGRNPLNRPGGWPEKGLLGSAGGFSILLGVPFVLTGSILTSFYSVDNPILSGNSLMLRGTMFPVCIFAGYFFQTGWIVALRIYRWFSGFLILNYFFTLLYFALAYFGVINYHATPGSIGVAWSFYLSLALLPCPFPLIWTLRNVRWFDPSSRPDEWEPPAKSKNELMKEGRARRAAKKAEQDVKH